MAEPVRRPAFWSIWMVAVATRVLPRGEIRNRYRQEFAAELYGMSRTRQSRYAICVLVRSWALRTAVGHRTSVRVPEVNVRSTVKPDPLTCRLNLRHRWRERRNPDGDMYYSCSRCEKDRYDLERHNGPNIGGNIAGMGGSGMGR